MPAPAIPDLVQLHFCEIPCCADPTCSPDACDVATCAAMAFFDRATATLQASSVSYPDTVDEMGVATIATISPAAILPACQDLEHALGLMGQHPASSQQLREEIEDALQVGTLPCHDFSTQPTGQFCSIWMIAPAKVASQPVMDDYVQSLQVCRLNSNQFATDTVLHVSSLAHRTWPPSMQCSC